MVQTLATVSRRRQTSDERLCLVFGETYPDLLRILTHFLNHAEDARDVAQETFLKCWRTREQVGTIRNLRAWIFRVGLNSARDLCRNVWRRRALPLDVTSIPLESPLPSPCEETLDREALDRVRAALNLLRPEEREVFLLRQNSPLTYEQIARLRRVPIGTVKTQMRSALAKLRGVLQEH